MPAAAGAAADTSTLIALASIGRFGLLRDYYGRVLVAPAVWREVAVEGAGRPGASEASDARNAAWLEVRATSDRSLVESLRRTLDQGEAETIALAVETATEPVLLDETDARAAAEARGLEKSGVIGLLIRARLENDIPSLAAEITRLCDAGFRIDDHLRRRALGAVGEL